jgi:nucleoside-diphosphate-sugar epimerase
VIVLGAEDPLARRVARALVASGHDVTVAVSGDDVLELSGASCRVIRWEDPDALRCAVVSHDAVVNLEPVMGEPRSTLRRLLDRPVLRRRAGQLAMVTRAFADAPATRWVQRSAPALYCDGGEHWLDEDWPIDTNPSTELTRCAEQAVSEHVGRGGIGVVLRLARPYGPDDQWTHQTLRLARKGWRPFDGPDPAFVPTVSLIDATAAVVAALEAPPGVYNLADPVPYTNKQLNVLVAAITRQGTLHPLHPSYSASDRDSLWRSHRLDVTAFTNATGWNPRLGPSAIAFVPSTRPLARLDTRR